MTTTNNTTANNNVINPNIEGYEFVKNVVEALGCERTHCDYLFAVKLNCGCGFGKKGLDAIVAVTKNTHDNYERLKREFPFDDYIVWHGTIIPNYNFKKREFEGNDRIEFYWS